MQRFALTIEIAQMNEKKKPERSWSDVGVGVESEVF